MNKQLIRSFLEQMAGRETFIFPDLVNGTGQNNAYDANPTGEGKKFWNQVANKEFDTDRYEIRPMGNGNPQRYQKLPLGQPILVPDMRASIADANALLALQGLTLAIVPIPQPAGAAA
jgi:hypothetical protein